MIFSSIKFLFLYLPVFLALYYAIPARFKNLAILVFSLLLIFELDHLRTAVLFFSICLNFFLGRMIGKDKRLWGIVLGVSVNIVLLSVFKYNLLLQDFIQAFSDVNTRPGQEINFLSAFALPVGISFYTFRAISYLVDVYNQKTEPEHNFINFAAFLALFPLIVAGPIARYTELKNELHGRKPSFQQIAGGIERFIMGLALKVLIANTLGGVADRVFSMPVQDISTPMAWLGLVAYTMQIFFDFAGYTDMAIGIGMILGFRIPENFNYPYIAKNVREFWRRWHISLSSWLRDYIFLPVAYSLSRKWKKDLYAGIRTDHLLYAVATMITFTLCVFWHGSSLSFVIWGMYYALFMIIEQVFLKRILGRLWTPLQHVYTLLVIMGGWVLFRTENPVQALQFYHKLLFWSDGSSSVNSYIAFFVMNRETLLMLVIATFLSTPLPARMVKQLTELSAGRKMFGLALSVLHFIWLITLFVLSLSYVVAQTYNPFIYFRF
jgi:alginate O-acetyltransferase complex protein AlgI